MRLAVVALLSACSFDHGDVATTGDAAGLPDSSVVVDSGVDAALDRSKKLVFDNSASTIDLVDFPVLVALDATTIDYARIADPTKDLRFEYATAGQTASVGDNVPFEIETWDPNGESIVWIRVPEIRAGTTDTAVLMHYGPNAAGLADAAATWADWELVHHMTSALTGSTGAYNGTPVNVTFGAGQIGESLQLAGGTNRGLTFANGGALFDGWTSFTLSFWLYADYNSVAGLGGSEPWVMDKGTSLTAGRLYASGSDIRFQVDLHFENDDINARILSVPPKTWTLVTITCDGATLSIAKNDSAFGSAALSGTSQSLRESTETFFIGAMTGVLDGGIDEMRIERRFRPNDWVRAQYLSMTRQFVTFADP